MNVRIRYAYTVRSPEGAILAFCPVAAGALRLVRLFGEGYSIRTKARAQVWLEGPDDSSDEKAALELIRARATLH